MAAKVLALVTISSAISRNRNIANKLLYYATTAAAPFECIKTGKVGAKKNVGLVTLDRPKVLNALNDRTVAEISQALHEFDSDATLGAIVITGNEKAFAAGADVKEMLNKTHADCVNGKLFPGMNIIACIKKPLIAAINGYTLGGGCVLALMCDIIYAGDNAKLGFPEINLGTIPGAGGTQRLVRSVGKSKAMEMVLSGNHVNAHEAERMGLLSKVFPTNEVLHEAIKTAEKIAALPYITVRLAKEAVGASYETTLQQGSEGIKAFSNQNTKQNRISHT